MNAARPPPPWFAGLKTRALSVLKSVKLVLPIKTDAKLHKPFPVRAAFPSEG